MEELLWWIFLIASLWYDWKTKCSHIYFLKNMLISYSIIYNKNLNKQCFYNITTLLIFWKRAYEEWALLYKFLIALDDVFNQCLKDFRFLFKFYLHLKLCICIFFSVLLNIPVSIIWKVQKAWELLKLELQAIMRSPIWMLESWKDAWECPKYVLVIPMNALLEAHIFLYNHKIRDIKY